MSLTVCTGWSPEGWKLYGQRFLETFERFWPADVKLLIYGEEAAGQAMLRYFLSRDPAARETGKLSSHFIQFHDLRAIPGCIEFLQRHAENLPARGLERLPQHKWKERAIQRGYNWRFDAWKFCRQGFIPLHAASVCETQFLCWLDGDVVTQRQVTSAKTITDLLPRGKRIAYLGREPKHPDIAFQLYDLRIGTAPHHMAADEKVHRMLESFARYYASDEVFKLGEWHSAYVWKQAVTHAEAWQAVHNLTPGGSGHVWQQSPLRLWGDHLKGDRKNQK